MATGGTLFEELGFFYVGPVDAHDMDALVPILENIRDNVPVTKPVLLHIKSIKGKGYPPAEAASDKYHGVAKFDVASGKQKVCFYILFYLILIPIIHRIHSHRSLFKKLPRLQACSLSHLFQ